MPGSELPQVNKSNCPINDGWTPRYLAEILLLFFRPSECGPLLVHLNLLKKLISLIHSLNRNTPLTCIFCNIYNIRLYLQIIIYIKLQTCLPFRFIVYTIYSPTSRPIIGPTRFSL